MYERSAGGVVINDDKVLILKRKNGGWVLPKGRIEKNETKRQAAQREVFEESGIKAKPSKYLGYSKYNFYANNNLIRKTVYYYLMHTCLTTNLKAQQEEGFVKACFVEYKKALELLIHNSERTMVVNAYKLRKD
ncbi:MAG: NUDIX hydrolase [Tissierellia bacterium]|nr:NUDIX hydrolase [Tissierellia bacterium]